MTSECCCGLLLCLGAGSAFDGFDPATEFRAILLCICLPPSPQQLIVASPGQPPPSRLFIESIRAGLGPIVSLVPPPKHILCWWAARTRHRPIFVLPWRLFRHPDGKIDGLEGNGGKRRHRQWCWVDMGAIVRWFGGHGHGFGGRSMRLLCVVREKVRYFCTYLTKKSRFAQLTFFNRSLRDVD